MSNIINNKNYDLVKYNKNALITFNNKKIF